MIDRLLCGGGSKARRWLSQLWAMPRPARHPLRGGRPPAPTHPSANWTVSRAPIARAATNAPSRRMHQMTASTRVYRFATRSRSRRASLRRDCCRDRPGCSYDLQNPRRGLAGRGAPMWWSRSDIRTRMRSWHSESRSARLPGSRAASKRQGSPRRTARAAPSCLRVASPTELARQHGHMGSWRHPQGRPQRPPPPLRTHCATIRVHRHPGQSPVGPRRTIDRHKRLGVGVLWDRYAGRIVGKNPDSDLASVSFH